MENSANEINGNRGETMLGKAIEYSLHHLIDISQEVYKTLFSKLKAASGRDIKGPFFTIKFLKGYFSGPNTDCFSHW